MKHLMYSAVAVFLVFLVLSCSKDRASFPVEPGNFVGNWNIVVDSGFQEAGMSNHLVVYGGKPGDYFSFATNGDTYTKEGGVYDTLHYSVLADSVHILISGFGLILNGVQDTSVISDRSATSMTITSTVFATPGGIFWRKVVLAR